MSNHRFGTRGDVAGGSSGSLAARSHRTCFLRLSDAQRPDGTARQVQRSWLFWSFLAYAAAANNCESLIQLNSRIRSLGHEQQSGTVQLHVHVKPGPYVRGHDHSRTKTFLRMIINRAPNSGPSKRKKRPPAADVRRADAAAGGRSQNLHSTLQTEGNDQKRRLPKSPAVDEKH